LIIEVAQGSRLERSLRELTSARPEVVVVGLAPDPKGRLGAPDSGHVIAWVPSPQALTVESESVRRAVEGAGGGAEPLLIVVAEAEELLDEQLAPLIEASERAPRAVILRVIHAADG
jgi:hypothetical protein